MSKNKKQPLWLTVLIMVVGAGFWYFTGQDPTGTLPDRAETLATPAATPLATTAPQPQSSNNERVDILGEEPGEGGQWWEIIFTAPEPGRINPADYESLDLTNSMAQPLIEFINAAQTSIYVAAFELNLTPIAEALIAAHERGVEVRWMTDDKYGLEEDYEEGHGQFTMLQTAGIEVRDDDRSGLMHNKFWVFDSKTVWTGSTNITVNGVLKNNNNTIIIDSPALAAVYEQEFEELWSGESGVTSASTMARQRVEIDGTRINVLFAAEDRVAIRLAELVAQAESQIRFMAFAFTHAEIGETMLYRAENGVDVQGLFETIGSETDYSMMGRMHCANVAVRQDGNPQIMHHKVMIIDERIVVTGSFNFSENADKSNDENLLVIDNSDIATYYLEEFDRRWVEGRAPDPEDVPCTSI